MNPEKDIKIVNNEDLMYLIDRFTNGPKFAATFSFENEELYNSFFTSIDINVNEFQKKYYYFDKEKSVHISESENGYVLISTMGLVAKSKITTNSYVNACCYQKVVLIHLLDDAIKLCDGESSYDIDSYCYSMIEELTPALFHNTIFYFETLAKAFLSINEYDVPHTHKLKILLNLVKKTMVERHQNNTIFHAYIIPMIEETVHHIETIPGKFKEEYVKYDDNSEDTTLIAFDFESLNNMRNLVEMSHDIITQMFYDPDNCNYLRDGLYQRLLQRCKTDEDKNRIKKVYSFLLEQQ